MNWEEARAEYFRNRTAIAKAAGLCVQCVQCRKNRAVAGRAMCAACSENAQRRHQARLDKAKAERKCFRCHAPVPAGDFMCAVCRSVHREEERDRREALQAASRPSRQPKMPAAPLLPKPRFRHERTESTARVERLMQVALRTKP